MSFEGTTAIDQGLLAAAQNGDEGAFERLVEPHRGELHAHCYRMLGSVHDAEDALQEALLRAWRGLAKFAGRSSLRSWLYRIATNACLDAIGRRPKRVLPVDYAPSDPHDGPGEPMVESTWIGPYPDEAIGVEDGYAAPEARYEQRESVELAFVAALQHLPANQRAALVLREDVETVVAMLTEDAAFTMPPLRSWFRGREEIAIFLADSPMSGEWQWKTVRTRANGQEAIAFYTWSPEKEVYERFALNVLTLRADGGISEVDAFLTRASDELPREEIVRLPEQPFDPSRLAAAFERFGLPEELPR